MADKNPSRIQLLCVKNLTPLVHPSSNDASARCCDVHRAEPERPWGCQGISTLTLCYWPNSPAVVGSFGGIKLSVLIQKEATNRSNREQQCPTLTLRKWKVHILLNWLLIIMTCNTLQEAPHNTCLLSS